MILHVDGRTVCGAVVDLRTLEAECEGDGASIAAAIRGGASPYGVHCTPPTEVHERVGFVRSGMGFATRTALAAAGRSRRLSTPHDDELGSVRDDLATLRTKLADQSAASLESGRWPADSDRERLRERVAELRGRVQALEGASRDASDARSSLRDAARRLSELETERVAAVETREHARSLRDQRERRLRLEDREANLHRAARSHLVGELRGEFATAVERLPPPGDDTLDPSSDPFEVDSVTAALAVLAVARVSAPVVLAVDRFDGPATAAARLDAPVIRL